MPFAKPVTLLVPCNGGQHRVTLNPSGPVILHDHPREHRCAEWALAEATGDLTRSVQYDTRPMPYGCFRVLQAWRRGRLPSWADVPRDEKDVAASHHRWDDAHLMTAQVIELRRKERRDARQYVDGLVATRIAIAAFSAALDIRRRLDDLGWCKDASVSVSFAIQRGSAVLMRPAPNGDDGLYVLMPGQALYRFWNLNRESAWDVEIDRSSPLRINTPQEKADLGQEGHISSPEGLRIWQEHADDEIGTPFFNANTVIEDEMNTPFFKANAVIENADPTLFPRYDLLPDALTFSRRCFTWPKPERNVEVPKVRKAPQIHGATELRLPVPGDFRYWAWTPSR